MAIDNCAHQSALQACDCNDQRPRSRRGLQSRFGLRSARDRRQRDFVHPFSKRGIGTGTNLLQQFVGIGKAMEWALLAPTLSAQEAERWGLVNRVLPLDRLEEETLAIVRQLAEGPTLVLAYTKSAIVNGWETSPEVAYRSQGQAVILSQQTEDLAEGIRAFREKRPPEFRGR